MKTKYPEVLAKRKTARKRIDEIELGWRRSMHNYRQLKTLFEKCAYRSDYDTIGSDVDYKLDAEGTHLIIYFQGSKDIKADKGWIDWLRNFWFFPTRKKPYKGMEDRFYVHSGFLAAWKEVEDIIIEKITSTDGNGMHLYDDVTIVGYSHGGALAQLCHECVWYYRPDLRGGRFRSYCFEAPRVVSAFFLPRKIRERWDGCFVIRNGTDIVTHCPPRLLGFRDMGEMIVIEGDLGTVADDVWDCVKYHFPQCVADGLEKADA